MSSPISIRFADDLAARLRRRRARSGEPTSGLVARLVDEGMRMEDHPGIVFRDGPAGRRAGLAGGPDVWKVIAALSDFAVSGPSKAAAKTAKWLGPVESRPAAFGTPRSDGQGPDSETKYRLPRPRRRLASPARSSAAEEP